MLKRFYPYEYVKTVFDIDYRQLYQTGYRALIFDIDNTLVHHGDDSNPQVDQLFVALHKIGFQTAVLSDNTEERVRRFLQNIDAAFVCDVQKPNTAGYDEAVRLLGVPKEKTLYLGDQIFRDILGANRSGIASVLVQFIRPDTEKRIGKRRQLEKLILAFYFHSSKYQHRLGGITKKECSFHAGSER